MNINELLLDVPFVYRAGKIYYSAVGVREHLMKNIRFEINDIEICPLYIYNNRCGDFYWKKMLITDKITTRDYILSNYKKDPSHLSVDEIEMLKMQFVDSRLYNAESIREVLIKYIDSILNNIEIKQDVLDRWGVFDVNSFYLDIY